MLITIHNSKLKKVAYIDNNKQDTLNFYNDTWSRYLETGTSTFDFTVYKKGIKSDTVKEKAYQTLSERSFVSFVYNKKTYLFNVISTEENETEIKCTCENLNLELLNENAAPYKASTEMSFTDYCNVFGLLKYGAITIGINEIEKNKRTLEWTGTDTKLKRLQSIAIQFDAEIEFETFLKNDSSLKSFILNIYKKNDGEKVQGVGKRRDDIVLRYGRNIKKVTRIIDKKDIVNMIYPVGRKQIDVTVTKPNPKYVAPKVGTVAYSGGSLSYGGHSISANIVGLILNLCAQHKLLPSGVFSQLYLESWWGASNVARADNNWGGLTWSGSSSRPSGVKVTQGSARPASEGGNYMHFASVEDYMKDYTFLLAEQGLYGVKGKTNIDDYTKGLFRVGGAKYDYAAVGYNSYLPNMRSIRSGINGANNNAMDHLDNQAKSAGSVSATATTVIASKTKSALDGLTALKGRTIGSGQCYALSAWYAQTLGGPGLGGGVTSIRGLIRGGMAAAEIGGDYNWGQYGWRVVVPTEVKHLIPGSIINIKANVNGPIYTSSWGHTAVIKNVSGDTLTILEQNFAGHQYVEERTYSASAYLRAIQSICYPPEIVNGRSVYGTEKSTTVVIEPGNNEPATISETKQEEKITYISKETKRQWRNSKGQVEYEVRGQALYAPISRDLYPSVFTGLESSDNWIRKNIEVETTDEEELITVALKELKKYAYPAITYEVEGCIDDLDIGDTIRIDDFEFSPALLLEARVSEQHISFTDSTNNKTVFNNFQALQSKISASLINRMDEIAEQAQPYDLRLSTDNGVNFKNSTGRTILTASLWKNNKEYEATFQFRNGENFLASGLEFAVDGLNIPLDTPFVVTVEAYIGNDLVATREVTFTNVKDGDEGKSSYTHIAYANSLDGTQDFSLTVSDGKLYRGEYIDNLTVSSGDPTKYTWARFKGEKGAIDEEQLNEINNKIDAKADDQLTQTQLDALSEQAELAKAELNAKASTDTLNQWLTAYNDYVRANENDKQEAEQNLINWSQRVESLGAQLGDVKSTVNYLDTYISQSAEGISIGKSDGNSSMMISNDRISMFSAGNEVMYISQGVIHIENGIFSKTIQIGRYREEQYAINPDMNVMRYVGGN
ncbi:TPA: phage tail protein [Streptococcus agalactiae]|nr:phage tail protein [Streptococcus agalactiae]